MPLFIMVDDCLPAKAGGRGRRAIPLPVNERTIVVGGVSYRGEPLRRKNRFLLPVD